jgi:hypothetical protein
MGHNSNFSELAYHSYERTLKKAELGKHMSDSEMYKKGKKNHNDVALFVFGDGEEQLQFLQQLQLC